MATDLIAIADDATLTISLSNEAQCLVDACDEETKRYVIASMEMFLAAILGNVYTHKGGGEEMVKLASSLLCDSIAIHSATMIDIIHRG